MKKILVAISVLLVAVMALSTTAFGADQLSHYDLADFCGQKTVVVGAPSTKAPVIDGIVSENEYTKEMVVTEAGYCNVNYVSAPNAPEGYEDYDSSEIKMYFSYDEAYIYIAIVDKLFYESSDKYSCATNFQIRIGTSPYNMDDYLQIGVASKTSPVLDITGNKEKWSFASIDAYYSGDDIDAEKYAKTEGYSRLVGMTVNGTETAPYTNTIELKLDKAKLLAINNENGQTVYEELPNTFFIWFRQQIYAETTTNVNNYKVFNATKLSAEQVAELGEKSAFALGDGYEFVPNLVVFGEEKKIPTIKTEPETTKAPETTAVPETTKAPETTAAPETTKAADNNFVAENKGCSSSISAWGLALVATVGTSAVFVGKKKRR